MNVNLRKSDVEFILKNLISKNKELDSECEEVVAENELLKIDSHRMTMLIGEFLGQQQHTVQANFINFLENKTHNELKNGDYFSTMSISKFAKNMTDFVHSDKASTESDFAFRDMLKNMK